MNIYLNDYFKILKALYRNSQIIKVNIYPENVDSDGDSDQGQQNQG